MKFVVDGYNLFHYARRRLAEPHSLLLSGLVNLVGAWASRVRCEVVLVFDGRRPPGFTAQVPEEAALAVRFAGGGVSADDVIVDFIETYSAARTLTVVSDDRVIRRVATRRRCKLARCEAFWTAVTRALARRPGPHEPGEKRSGLTNEQTDYWLREFGLDQA